MDKGMIEQFTFFWKGPLSQWHPSPFTIDGIVYNCCEQFMMAEKARRFNDPETLDLIMKSSSPKFQKALGRHVKNFNQEYWNGVAKYVVYIGNHYKFIQNKDLLKHLEDTKGTTLVECSPYDKIWGIGLVESDPRVKNRDTWLGTNWLGEVLTQVRIDLLGE